jgi:double-strand break repair protein MRE11
MAATALSDEVVASLAEMDSVKVAKLVEEYLKAQSLKILPQAPFGDAVTQFVDKDDKHAMEEFVNQSLSGQVKQMLSLDDNDEDLESAMEKIKQTLEQQFATGQLKRGARRVYKPKPDEWDSDLNGHWEDQPQALDHAPLAQEAPQPAQPRSRARKPARPVFMDDEDEEMNDIAEEDPTSKPKGRSKAVATRAKAAPKAPAKKAPAKGRGRGRKEAEDEDDEDEDVFMDDDKYDPPAPPPKRTTTTRATTTRSQPSRSQASSRASASASASAQRTRQTRLNFSQKATQQEPLEISDDEISDDPFESAPASRAQRR